MDLWILDKNFVQVGVLDDYTSLIWSKRYNALGDCEIYIGANERTINLLKKGYFVQRLDDDMICQIETVEIDTDTESGDFLIVTGRDCRKILNQRIVWDQTNFSGTAENFIRKIINENVISPSKSARRISNFTLGTTNNFPETIDIQSTYDYLFDKIQELCQTFGYGSKVTYNGVNFIFNLYKGVDRSIDQIENEVVIFSPQFENLISTKYKTDSSDVKTSALVAGEGEGSERVRQEISGGSGLDRYELFVDAKDISSKTDDEQQMTDAEYKALLRERGNEKLADHVPVVSFDGEVEPNYSYKYGEDYFLGDIVTIENEYGISANARVIEVIESDDDKKGYSIIPTFEFIEVEEQPILMNALMTESEEPIETENGEQLLAEAPMLLGASPSSSSGVRISELPESTDLYDGCCVPVVTNGETKKFTFALLKEKLATIFLQKTEVADYIVEQGTSGNWTYRKWNSGIAECWGEETVRTRVSNAWGSVFESPNSYNFNYPNGLFVSRPIFNATRGSTGTAGWLEIEGTGSNVTTPSIYIIRPLNTANEVNYAISMIAKGRWK